MGAAAGAGIETGLSFMQRGGVNTHRAPQRVLRGRRTVVCTLACSLLLLACSGLPGPSADAAFEDWTVGGVQQRLWMRGPGNGAPAVLVLHGGPGASATGLFRKHQRALEERYRMVYWDQRGTGRSYHATLDPKSMTLDRMVQDTHEVVQRLRQRHGTRELHLLGHSWGGLLAYEYATQFPGSIDSLMLVAPALRPLEGETVSWQWTLQQAWSTGQRDAIRDLQAIGTPPHTVQQQLVLRRWTERLGGSFAGPMRTRDLILDALSTPEVGLWDLVLFGRGNRFSMEALHDDITAAEPDPQAAENLQVLTILGRHDWQVPAVVSEAFAEALPGPCKHIVWIQDAGHHIPYEQPEAFTDAVVQWIDEPPADCPPRPPDTQSDTR